MALTTSAAARDEALLREVGVTHVVDASNLSSGCEVRSSSRSVSRVEGVQYCEVNVQDEPEAPLSRWCSM